MSSLKIGNLRGALRTLKAKLQQESSRVNPKTATLHRLRREIDRVNVRLAEAQAEQVQEAQQRRAKRQGKPMKRSGPLPATNPERKAKMDELRFSNADGYGKFIKDQPCVWCGAPPPSDRAHILGVDLGGTAEDLLPLCRTCHHWQELHKKAFEVQFTVEYGVPPLDYARQMRIAYIARGSSGASGQG